jgi:hypothetical protein
VLVLRFLYLIISYSPWAPATSEFHRRMSSVQLALAALALLPVVSTASGSQQEALGPSPRDRNYPVLNPDAHQTVHIKVRIPDTLDIRLFAVYHSTPPLTKKTPCGEWVGWDAHLSFPFVVLVPLEMPGPGPVHDSALLADRFERGTCGWVFGGISFNLAGSAHESIPLNLVASFKDSAPLTAQTATVRWCGIGLNGLRPGVWCDSAYRVFINPWKFWKDDPRRVELMKRIPEDEWKAPGAVVVPPNTNELALNFYDIDAIVKLPLPAQ